MKVYCTPQFVKAVERLMSNSSYSAVLDDVCAFLAERDVTELHQMNDVLRTTPGFYSLNKHRVANSLSNKGKSGSYRCISVCLPKEDIICLGYIYPKTGTQGKDNLEKEDYKRIALNVQKSIAANELYVVDISKRSFKMKSQTKKATN